MAVRREVRQKETDRLISKQHATFPLIFSCRLDLALMSFLGFTISYTLRTDMSVALVCMLNETALSEMNDQTDNVTTLDDTRDACYMDEMAGNEDRREGEFVWDKDIQGIVLGSFFWGYVVTQLPGGWLATRLGSKRVYGYCILGCSIATLLIPAAARLDYRLLVALRVVVGLFQGATWPAMHAMWAKWAPPFERSKLGGISFAGGQMGNVVTFSVAGLLCAYGFDDGWPSIFYIFGMLGVIWFGAWMFIVADSPMEHTRITNEERDYITKATRGTVTNMNASEIKWKKLLTSPGVWAICIAHTCGHWATYTFLTNIPTYMNEVLKFNIEQNGLLSALPYLFYWLFIIVSGYLADFLRSRGLMNTTNTRKLFTTLGLFVPALFVIGTGFVDCNNPYLAVGLLTAGIGICGCQYQGSLINPGDIAPRYSGIIFGIANTFGTVPGILAPLAISKITVDQTQEQWRTVFFICAGINVFGCLIFLIFGTGQLQEWARDDEFEFIVPSNTSPVGIDRHVDGIKQLKAKQLIYTGKDFIK